MAAALEELGFGTRLVERAYDADFHPVTHANPARNEPTVALAGFDGVEPRRQLGDAGFSHIVDAGLGAGPVEYLDLMVQSFPSPQDPRTAFKDDGRRPLRLAETYEAEIARQTAAGANETAARCGMLDIAGVTVGAAFVGAFASTLVVADILRLLHDGVPYSVIAVDLRDPSALRAVINSEPGEYTAPAFTLPN